jgi:Fe-S-cluster containining protein
VTLSVAEATDLSARYGTDKVYLNRWGEWRTRVRGGKCIFLADNTCTIHADPSYPAVCRAFPWTDAETGGAYEYDQTICPEFVTRPELLLLGKPDRIRP